MASSEIGIPTTSELPRRLAIAIHSLVGGGAERTAARLASHWAGQGVDVTLITLDSSERDSYPLNAGVRRVGLGLMAESRSRWEAIRNNAGRLRALRRAIQTTGAARLELHRQDEHHDAVGLYRTQSADRRL